MLHRRLRTGTLAALALLSLAFMYGPALHAHMAKSANPLEFNGDARIWLYPLDRYHDASLFPADYLGDYAKACTGIGYRAFYRVFSPFTSATSLSKVLPYVLLAVIAGAIGIAAARHGGLAAAWVGVALCFSTDLFLRKLMGGLPRSFAFPIIACAAAALVYGRMRLLALIVCLGASLYPPAALVCGMALAVVLLILPSSQRGHAATWSLTKRLAVLALTVSVSAVLLLPTELELGKYGRFLRPADAQAYPETGPEGRFYAGTEHTGFGSLRQGLASEALETVLGAGKRWIPVARGAASNGSDDPRRFAAWLVLGISAVLFVRLLRRDPSARRLGVLLVVAVVCRAVSGLAIPYLYLPQRYLAYPIPVFVILMVSAAAGTVPLGKLPRGPAWHRGAVTMIAGGLCLIAIGGRGSIDAGHKVRPELHSGVFAFLASLPKDALIAGWPEGAMDSVPYLSRRDAFLTRELHQPFQAGFTEELRRRMRALIDAYLGTDERPLRRLHDEFGVTHLIVDIRDFDDHAPGYFAPFDGWARDAFDKGRTEGFELPRLVASSALFKEGPYAVLDLSRMEECAVPRSETSTARLSADEKGAIR